MHGIADTYKSMESMAKLINQYTGAYVLNCEVGNGFDSSLFMSFDS